MRKPRDPRYKQPATYIDEFEHEHFIRVYTDERQSLTTPMGVSLMLDDGDVYVETDEDIVFKKECFIKVGSSQQLSIKQIISRTPKKGDMNAIRGVPTYVTKMIIN